jgi:hypothetical protein
MRAILARGRELGARRTAELIDALVETAEAELPADLKVERQADGISIAGRGLARRIAFDPRLRSLALLLKGMRQ